MHIYPWQINPPSSDQEQIPVKPLHQIHFIYSTMHIYPWQIDPTPSQLSIDTLNTTTPNLADLMADLLAPLN